ncbi:hypothetical protein H0H87_007370, partial [Tephrocybe sp. NHM501043]
MSLLPALPPELVGHIIDHLYDDPATLKCCALVCRVWLTLSRSHIFRHIVLTPPRYTKTFFPRWGKPLTTHGLYSVVQATPEVASYIRDVEIIEGIGAGEWTGDEQLASLLLLLNNVQRFQLRRSMTSHIVWGDLPSNFKSSILHLLALPSFRELHLGTLSFAGSEELRQLLGSSKGLRTVCLDRLRILGSAGREPTLAEGDSSISGLTPLDTLVLGARTSPLIMNCLLHPRPLLNIASLRKLDLSMSGNFAEFARLLRSAVRLESLEILLMSDIDLVAYQALQSTESLDLSHNPYVTTLTVRIDIIQRQDDPLPWLDGLFLTVTTPNNLRNIHIVYSLYLPSPYMDRSVNTTIFTSWKDIDATLTGPVFESLERVWLEFSLENPIGFDVAPRFLKEVDLQSPALQAR